MVKTTETGVDERIGANIRRARIDADMSQAELAAAAAKDSGLDWSERLVARMEAGGRPLRYSEAVVLGRVLSVPVATFSDDGDSAVLHTARVRRVQRALKGIGATGWPLIDGIKDFVRANLELGGAMTAMGAEELTETFGDSMPQMIELQKSVPTDELIAILDQILNVVDAGKELLAAAASVPDDRFAAAVKGQGDGA